MCGRILRRQVDFTNARLTAVTYGGTNAGLAVYGALIISVGAKGDIFHGGRNDLAANCQHSTSLANGILHIPGDT